MNKQQRAILRTELQSPEYAGLSYEAIASALNAQETAEQPNPITEAPQIPRAVTMMDILEAVGGHDPTKLATLAASLAPIDDRFERDLQSRNMRAINNFYLPVYASSLNTAAQDAIQELLNATEPDPSWTETITTTLPSRAAELGLPVVRCEDIQAALNYEVV